jgi:hypothetical protein
MLLRACADAAIRFLELDDMTLRYRENDHYSDEGSPLQSRSPTAG